MSICRSSGVRNPTNGALADDDDDDEDAAYRVPGPVGSDTAESNRGRCPFPLAVRSMSASASSGRMLSGCAMSKTSRPPGVAEAEAEADADAMVPSSVLLAAGERRARNSKLAREPGRRKRREKRKGDTQRIKIPLE